MKTVGIFLGVLIAIFAGLFLLIVQPGPSGVIASLRLADGSEYMVTQRCNWSAEPYTVAFYMRSPGEPWGWCYIDHEASRWRNVRMSHEAATDSIIVTRGGTRRAVLDRKRSMFWIDNGSGIQRELSAPQELSPPEFPFP
jgi:hypothetical protein